MHQSKQIAFSLYVKKTGQVPVFKAIKQADFVSGTPFAIKNKLSSGASDCNWGGKRNSASRTSSSLSLVQATNIIAATNYAAAIGLPFNRFLTIHWEQAGIADNQVAWATGRFLKLANDWLRKRGGRIAWVWVRENGDGKGSHVHILIHLPVNKITGENGRGCHVNKTLGKQHTGLGNMPRRWLRLITGSAYLASTIKTERIAGSARAAHASPAFYHANLMTVLGYVLKGADEQAAKSLHLVTVEAGGRIIGKRCGASQNIGATARLKHHGGHIGNRP